MKIFTRIMKITLISFCSLILMVLIYVLYLQIQYSRFPMEKNIEIQNNQDISLSYNKDYEITTYNIGFGAYDQEFSFFMDTGTMLDGRKTKGKHSIGRSKSNVLNNTNGSIEELQKLNSDFYLLQEVDTKSRRSYKINQKEMLTSNFNSYANTFAINFHSAFLAYPLHEFHGTVNSGLLTLSKYQIDSSTRIKLPIDESFPNKFFDLDRCINITRYPIGEKELVIINAHLSAYDKGGVFRKLQLELLKVILDNEKTLDNYVILGGDFNHDIANSKELWETTQKTPEWIFPLTNENISNGYSIIAATNAPTVRGADIPYIKNNEKTGVHTAVIDGFIVSDNITVNNVTNIDLDFKYSDHNPVHLSFKINN